MFFIALKVPSDWLLGKPGFLGIACEICHFNSTHTKMAKPCALQTRFPSSVPPPPPSLLPFHLRHPHLVCLYDGDFLRARSITYDCSSSSSDLDSGILIIFHTSWQRGARARPFFKPGQSRRPRPQQQQPRMSSSSSSDPSVFVEPRSGECVIFAAAAARGGGDGGGVATSIAESSGFNRERGCGGGLLSSSAGPISEHPNK